MSQNLQQVRSFARKTVLNSNKCQNWTWAEYIAVVEKIARQILKLYPEANREIVLLSVWFHDISRAFGQYEDHDVYGAEFARDYLMENDYPQEIVDGVYQACLSHRAEDRQPQTLEAKILTAADALSHFDNGFYLKILNAWSQSGKDYESLKARLVAKIERDFHQKILLDEVKQAVKPMYESWKTVLGTVEIKISHS